MISLVWWASCEIQCEVRGIQETHLLSRLHPLNRELFLCGQFHECSNTIRFGRWQVSVAIAFCKCQHLFRLYLYRITPFRSRIPCRNGNSSARTVSRLRPLDRLYRGYGNRPETFAVAPPLPVPVHLAAQLRKHSSITQRYRSPIDT